MEKETFTIEISVAERGRTYRPQILDTFEIESDNIFKDVAKIISEQDVFAYRNGLYFKVKNVFGEEEKFWAANKGDTMFVRYCSNQYDKFSSGYTDWDIEPRYLTCLDEEKNEYKYYLMTFDKDADNFNVQYGRIGMRAGEFNYRGKDASKDGSYEFPAPMFWIKYYEKIAKGYEDKTELKDFGKQQITRTLDEKEYNPIEEEKTRRIIEHLISRQREYVQRSFDLSVPFSQKAVELSKNLLAEMHTVNDPQEFKQLYKELVTTLPRKIYDVREYINRVDFKDKESDNYITKVLETEQELFDNFCDMFGADEKNSPTDKKTNCTVLDYNGMKAQVADFKDKFDYLIRMGDDAHRVSNIIGVTNERTKSAYETCKAQKGIENRGCHLLWHGSRTENWWSIAKNGLSLNPNAVITGKMFGQGLYFAPKAQKSMGYTDMQGSYWAGGTSKTGYLALFEVAMGKPYEPSGALSCNFRETDLRHGCHSVWAYPSKTGLRNEECIVYNEGQANMVALVEIDSSRTIPFHFDLKQAQKLQIKNIAYTEDNNGHGHITVDVPDFNKRCFPLTSNNVSFDYDIDAKRFEIKASDKIQTVTMSERDFLSDVFMSKFCENEREFSLIAEEIKELGDIPKDIQKQFNRKGREKDESRIA